VPLSTLNSPAHLKCSVQFSSLDIRAARMFRMDTSSLLSQRVFRDARSNPIASPFYGGNTGSNPVRVLNDKLLADSHLREIN